MIDTIVAKAKGLLLEPVETFQESRTDEPATVLTCFAVLLFINAVLSAIVAAAIVGAVSEFAGLNIGAPLPVVIFFAVLVGGFILTLIFAAWVHLWVYIFGGRKGLMPTVIAIVYGQTPRLLLGWIPVIGIFFALWSLALNIIGIRELQELSTMKATLVVAIAVLIPLILILLAFAFFFISSASTVLVPAGSMPPLMR
jgi:hypothetical protein